MTIDKRVAFGLVIYAGGLVAGEALLPLDRWGVWPLVAWTAFCVVLGLVIAEITALSSAIGNLPSDSERGHPVPVRVHSAQRRSRHGQGAP